MAPGEEESRGGGEGGAGDDAAAARNGGNGVAAAPAHAPAAPAPAAPSAATVPPFLQQQQRAPGGFKIKVKLPPRLPSGDGAGGGGTTLPSSMPTTATMKRPAEGPPLDASGAGAPPQKLKITLKGFKLGGGGNNSAAAAGGGTATTTTTPRGPAPLSPGSVATSPAATAAAGSPSGGGSKPTKRVRSAKPPSPAPPPLYDAGGDSDAAVPWADEAEVAAPSVAPPSAATTAAPKMKKKNKRPPSAAGVPAFVPAHHPQQQQRDAAAAAEEEERRASRAEASPGPSSLAAAAAVAGGGCGKKSSKAATNAGTNNGGEVEDGDVDGDEGAQLLHLPKLHPTRSATREAVIRISDAVDVSVPDVPLERNQAIALVEKVAKRDKEGVFRDIPTDDVAPGYSKLILRPIAFSTIRARALEGGYRESGWDGLCGDLDQMLDNCRAYNGPDSPWGLYADSFQLAAARMMQLSRAGVTDLRGKTGNLFALKQGGDGSGDEAGGGAGVVGGGVGRYFRDASGGGERGSERGERGERGATTTTAAAAAGPSLYGPRIRTTGRGGGLLRSLRADAEAARDGLPRRLDDDGNWLEWRFSNKRASYPARIGGAGVAAAAAAASTSKSGESNNNSSDGGAGIAAAAGGLARGHNGDGHALLGALALLPSYVGAPPSDAYARSVARFSAGLKGRARERALAVAAASLPPLGSQGGGGSRQQSVRPSPLQQQGGRRVQLPMPA